jgi:adenylosuccinate lyase
VDVDRRKANLDATKGLVYSQAVLLALVDAGMTRDEAYRIVQMHAMSVWEGDGDLEQRLRSDPQIRLEPESLASCFDPARVSRTATVVFERLDSLRLG